MVLGGYFSNYFHGISLDIYKIIYIEQKIYYFLATDGREKSKKTGQADSEENFFLRLTELDGTRTFYTG